MKLKYALILMILLICGIIITGCINSKTKISNSPTPASPTIFSTTKYPTILPTKEITIVPVIANLQKYSIDGWQIHNIPNSEMSIYIPKGWTTQIRNRTFDGTTYYNILVALSPDFDILINAYSRNFADERDLLQKELNQGYVDDDMYQSLVNGLTSTNSRYVSVSEIVMDPVYYSISGYPARKIEWKQDGAPIKEYIIIPNNNSIMITKIEDTTSSHPSYYMENERHMEGEESIKSATR